MKKLFEWVKASPKKLPPPVQDRKRLNILFKGEPATLVYINGKWNWDDDSIKYVVNKDLWQFIEYLSPVEQEPVDESFWKDEYNKAIEEIGELHKTLKDAEKYIRELSAELNALTTNQ